MKDLKNWKEISKGYYRYAIASNVAYEIIVDYWEASTHIETAKASLCLIGLWGKRDGSTSMEREWLAKELPIQELLEIAYIDNRENNK